MDGAAKVIDISKRALTEDAVAALETPVGRAPSWLVRELFEIVQRLIL